MRPALPLAIALFAAGCAHGAAATRSKGETAFIAAAPTDVAADEPARLGKLARGSAEDRAVRLDRLLDLLDAARFGSHAGARDALWESLGGHTSGRGAEATREALSRLLDEAMAIDEQPRGISESTRAFVRDAIALLTTDLETPGSADDLAVRTLAYRTLAEQGHARIRDNAQWRLYDHVRGTLAGALAAAPETRSEVAVQVLYADREDLSAELADAPVQERPPWIGGRALVAELQERREALAALPAWQTVIAARNPDDEELRRTVLATLPAARDPKWAIPLRPKGTGVGESLAPVLLVGRERVEVDAGRPQARALTLGDDVEPVAEALRASLAQDGRGVVLVAVDPELATDQLRRTLRAIRRAHAARIELAIREPHGKGDTAAIVTALPLELVHGKDDGAGATAIAAGRLHVHVDGKGLAFAHDGRVLATIVQTPADLSAMLERIARAYPRERTLRVTIGEDAPLPSLLDLLVATTGGGKPRFAAVGWLKDDARPPAKPDRSADAKLELRATLASSRTAVRIDQPFPLAGEDQGRLQAFAEQLWRCVPELETTVPASKTIELSLVFEGGRVHEVVAKPVAKVPPARLAALRKCVEDEAYALRLREHRDRVTIGIGLVAGK